MATIHTVSLGCPKNRVDTEQLLGALPDLVPVDDAAGAECILVNTCGFIAPAIEESVRAILEGVRDKENATRTPRLVVAGCLVGRFGEKTMAPDLPEVDLWLDNRELDAWPEKLAALLGISHQAPAGKRFLSTPPSYAWLKISEGCNHSCSFCTIPSIRGPFHSYPKKALLRESRLLLDSGVSELVLVAQDTSAWRDDGDDLRGLLEALLPLPGLARLRLMYLYPAGLTDSLLSWLAAAGEPFVPYFDVPLQHADPDILGRMGRPFARDPRRVIERIRKHFPDAALRTSLITGFPGESDEAFGALRDFVCETRFLHLGVFAYEAEDGTPAAAMPDQVPHALKQERREELMRIQAGISEELLAAHLGRELPILVDAPHPDWPGLYTGRAWFQAPECDGVTYISGPGVEVGRIVTADITETQTYDLVALA